jgi:hypothetical protein
MRATDDLGARRPRGVGERASLTPGEGLAYP